MNEGKRKGYWAAGGWLKGGVQSIGLTKEIGAKFGEHLAKLSLITVGLMEQLENIGRIEGLTDVLLADSN